MRNKHYTDTKHNTDNTDFVKALIVDTVAEGITDPTEIVEHITGAYTKNGKEIKHNGRVIKQK